jgi:hypothetical protein
MVGATATIYLKLPDPWGTRGASLTRTYPSIADARARAPRAGQPVEHEGRRGTVTHVELTEHWTCLLCGTETATRKHDCAARLRASYRDGWQGALRRGAKVVATCGHRHRNRDQSSWTGGTAAQDCARTLLNVLMWGERFVNEQLSWMSRAHGIGSHPGMGEDARYAAELNDALARADQIRPQLLIRPKGA